MPGLPIALRRSRSLWEGAAEGAGRAQRPPGHAARWALAGLLSLACHQQRSGLQQLPAFEAEAHPPRAAAQRSAGERVIEPVAAAVAASSLPPSSPPPAALPLHVDVPLPWPPPPPASVSTDFCIHGVPALDPETCYVLPAAPTRELLIYLHGLLPPGKSSQQKTNFETVVKNACERAGVAALMPRGRKGFAPRDRASWWGWPTLPAAQDRFAGELVMQLNAKRSALEALLGRRFERVYLAGSSAGAYFVAALALTGGIEADGFAVLSGGSDRASAALDALPPRPLYIGFGIHDTVAGSARALGQRVRQAGWPVLVAPHPLPHGAKEVYLDEAFAFFREQGARPPPAP